jgi:hypothetical protein
MTDDPSNSDSDPDPDPEALADDITEQLVARFGKDYHRQVSDHAVFCSPGDYDALHRTKPDSPLVTTYADKLSGVEIRDDRAIPDGDPRVLPESLADFRSDERLQDLLTNYHARDIVNRYGTIECYQTDKFGAERVRVSVDVPFEVLSDQTELDRETIDEHGLHVTASASERGFGRGECVRPVQFTAQYASAGLQDGMAAEIREPSDSPIPAKVQTQLRRTLAASISEEVGGSASFPITGEKEVIVEPDDPPAAFEDGPHGDWDDLVDYQTETMTFRCGERILNLGRIHIPDPADE